MTDGIFRALMLIARPAAGKSEIIRFLKSVALEERMRRFHIGKIDEIDDFPMIWIWFEEDDLLSRMGKPRLHSDDHGDFKEQYFWDVLIQRISLEYHKRLRDYPSSPEPVTALIEFARGTEHGGFREAFENISAEVASQAGILYVNVSFEESLRKNRKRFNPERPDSILEHGLPDEKMARIYQGSDWQEVSGGRHSGTLPIQGAEVPFVVFENEDDVTTLGGEPLGQRLEETLGLLWRLYQAR